MIGSYIFSYSNQNELVGTIICPKNVQQLELGIIITLYNNTQTTVKIWSSFVDDNHIVF